jgi:hypothetical protein
VLRIELLVLSSDLLELSEDSIELMRFLKRDGDLGFL